MSSPGEPGSHAVERDLRQEPGDASVTASLPAVSADTGAYPRNGRPGAVSRDDWKGPGLPLGGSAPGAAPHARTEVVPSVAPVPQSVPPGVRPPQAGSPEGDRAPRSPFASQAGGLPPRPGEGVAAGAGAAGGAATATAPGKRPLRRAPRPARRAQLTLRRFNVWSVFKFSCMLAIALWLVWMIAVGVLYGIIDAAGVVKSLNDVYAQIQGDNADAIIRPGQVLGIAAIIGVVNIVLFIALSSVFAVIYNLVSDFVGGVEVTLSERE